MKCISCGINSTQVTVFKCPNCGKYQIVRCSKCKTNAVLYKCPECGFVGP